MFNNKINLEIKLGEMYKNYFTMQTIPLAKEAYEYITDGLNSDDYIDDPLTRDIIEQRLQQLVTIAYLAIYEYAIKNKEVKNECK